MTNEYTAAEVIEIGKAQTVILGAKGVDSLDVDLTRDLSDNELDD